MRVAELRRYPIKSMLGETPDAVTVGAAGVEGDRVMALVDAETDKVASAKDPRRWAPLLTWRARYVAGDPPAAEVTLPDGRVMRSDDPGFDAAASSLLGRPVRLSTSPAAGAAYDDVWPDIEGLAPPGFIESTRTAATQAGEAVSTLPVGMMAPGTFQDVAPITILTTASLRAARTLHPEGEWDPRRFRANLLIDVDGEDFVENAWTGRTLRIGDVELAVAAPTPRCVMTTLAQPGLGADRRILQTLARANRAELPGVGPFTCLGTYATVTTPGRIDVGAGIEMA